MRTRRIICKPHHRTFKEYNDLVALGVLIFALITTIIYYPYAILFENSPVSVEAEHFMFLSMISILTFGILYYNWAQSYQCSTIITEEGIYVSREKMRTKYKKAYRKGYFISWMDITKMSILKEKTQSGWKCIFITKYGDTIEISSSLRYPGTCIPKLIRLGNKLKNMGIDVIIARNILNHSDIENKEYIGDENAK